MDKNTTILNHVAVQYDNKENADIFFNKILKIPLLKEFKISADLSKKIFDIDKETDVLIYDNKKLRFEVFLSDKKRTFYFDHICIEVDDRRKFVKDCKKYDVEINFIDRNGKKLLFVKDFAGNLYEVKQK